jgi:hypothetical protein
MSQTPYTRLTTAQLNSLASTTLANLYPYQIWQVMEVLDRVNWGPKGSNSDMSGQPTISAVITALGSNNP